MKAETYFTNPKFKHLHIPKNQVLQEPGGIASKAYYVKSGLLRSYMIDDNGKVHNFMFAPEGWIISDIESHTLGEPGKLFIDTLEDSEVVEVNQITVESFTKNNMDNKEIVEKLFRRIAVLQKRVILLMSATAKQRYEHFLETYPQLVNRISQKMIASYLGITPEALSNIRSKIRKQVK